MTALSARVPLRRVLRDVLLAMALFANATWWWPLLRDPRRASPLDWTAFYRASGAVLAGRLASAYAESVHGAHVMPLLYPPPMFILLAPLGFGPAWFAYRALQLATLAAFAITIGLLRRTLADRSAIFAALCLCSAPWVLDVQLGQLGMLWVLGFVVAMRAFERERGFTAGLALSLFALKPTLGAFVAFALLVRADRRALAGFACGVAALIVASLPLGPAVWPAYRDASVAMARLVDSGGVDNWRQQTMRVAVRVVAGDRALSHGVYAAMVLLALPPLARSIRRARGPSGHLEWLGLTALATAVLSPYLYLYDAVLLFVPAAHWMAYPSKYTPRARVVSGAAMTALFVWQLVTLLGAGRSVMLAGPLAATWLVAELVPRRAVETAPTR